MGLESEGREEVSVVMAASAAGRPRCFFDVSIDGIEQGRIVFELCVPNSDLLSMHTSPRQSRVNATLAYCKMVAGKSLLARAARGATIGSGLAGLQLDMYSL